ncbi:MAG: ATP-binding cassette domain-containing protein [Verrucomicrobiales bacterium]|nr:ATP-binding cassette domain-containing protein [Verrucomicrobiales bacterium]
MIDALDLSKQYAGRVAIDRLNFQVDRGEIVGFLGPNGAGKSTTMRILSGFMPPTSGRAMVAGYDVFRESLAVRRRVGYMPEMAPLYQDMRVKEYLHFRAELKGLRGRDMRIRTGEVMELCSITDVRRRLIGNLSKGYKQRVALADALVHRPDLLILDEPTNGLDPTQIRQVRELLRSLRQDHTILLSTHILHEVELTCDRVILLHQGKICAQDTPRNLTRQLRATSAVRVELKGAEGEAQKDLQALTGVRKVIPRSRREEGWETYVLRVESQSDVRESIMDLALRKGWKIRELHRQLPTLEDVFVEITAGDGVPAQKG